MVSLASPPDVPTPARQRVVQEDSTPAVPRKQETEDALDAALVLMETMQKQREHRLNDAPLNSYGKKVVLTPRGQALADAENAQLTAAQALAQSPDTNGLSGQSAGSGLACGTTTTNTVQVQTKKKKKKQHRGPAHAERLARYMAMKIAEKEAIAASDQTAMEVDWSE